MATLDGFINGTTRRRSWTKIQIGVVMTGTELCQQAFKISSDSNVQPLNWEVSVYVNCTIASL